MHISSGMINRFLDNARQRIRKLESCEEFMVEMSTAEIEVRLMLEQLAITPPKGQENQSVLAPLHKESKQFCTRIDKLMKNIQALGDKKRKEEADRESNDDAQG